MDSSSMSFSPLMGTSSKCPPFCPSSSSEHEEEEEEELEESSL